MFGALSQLTESQPLPPPPTTKIAVPTSDTKLPLESLLKVEDPLRELVICAEKDEDPEKLKFLALSAANLAKEESEILRQQQQINQNLCQTQSQDKNPSGLNVLAGIFVGTESLIKKVEGNLRKKFAVLDPSDSEGFGGKISLLKLIKIVSALCHINCYII